MRHVILDTDIGTDVDDLLALVFLAKAPELCLEGVTTVHGNTLLRAKIARIACQKLGIPDLPVVPGAIETLSGGEIFWPGHEGENIPGIENASVETSRSASQFFLDLSEKFSGELEILAIGPLTNLAQTISCFPEFRTRVKRLYLMGGAYWTDYSEHNLKMDVIAGQNRLRIRHPNHGDRPGCDVEGLDKREARRANPKSSERFGNDARRADQAMVEISGREPEQSA